MILFVFEGKDDKTYFESIKRLFFPEKSETIVCTYNSNIYSLYTKLMGHDAINELFEVGTVSVFKEILLAKGDETLKDIREDEVSEIYLFFDYDFQEKRHTLTENNHRLSKMLEYFTDETNKGKLYISYPMVESIRYTKELPDKAYWNYVVSRQMCKEKSFKQLVHEFSFYGSNEYIVPNIKEKESAFLRQKKQAKAKQNWKYLVEMNISKANFICKGINKMPEFADEQKEIFEGQLSKYVNTTRCEVSILSAFPIFLFDYFGREIVSK